MDNSFIKDISDSLTTNVHCSSLTIYPNKEVPLDLFLDRLKILTFINMVKIEGKDYCNSIWIIRGKNRPSYKIRYRKPNF